MPAAVHDRMRLSAASATSALDTLVEVAWESTDAEILELCRLRIAAMLGDDVGLVRSAAERGAPSAEKVAALGSWWNSDLFSERERARIAFTEQFVTSVASMTDDDVDALLAHDSEEETYRFVCAVYAMDAATRACIVSRALFADDDAPAAQR